MTTHLTPDSSGRTRCCGKTVDELPLGDEFAVFDEHKTCPHCGYFLIAGAQEIERVELSGPSWESIPASDVKVTDVKLFASKNPPDMEKTVSLPGTVLRVCCY